MAGTSPNLACNYTDTRSSQPNDARRTPDFPYLLVSAKLFSPSSPIFLFLFHNTTIIARIQSSVIPLYLSMKWLWVNTKWSIRLVQHTPTSAYTEYSLHWVQHSLSTAYTECSKHLVQHTPSGAYTEYSIHWVQHTLSTAYTKYSIHWIQHTPSTASPHNCLSSLHSQYYELTPECSCSCWRASQHDQPPSSNTWWVVQGKVTLPQFHICESINWWIDSQHPSRHPSTTSKYSSNLAQSRFTKCITNHTWLQPPGSHNPGLQVHLEARSIIASRCISWLTRWPPSCESPNLLDQDIRVHL